MKEKRWVKYLCLFALTLVLALSAAGTKQAQAATKSGSCGDKATYEYDTSTKTLTISGSGTVTYSDDWEDFSTSVKKIVIEGKITKIDDAAFYGSYFSDSGFSGLTSVDMKDSAVKTIGASAFMYCKKLKTVTFSTKLTKISYYAFYGCSKLSSVSLPSSLKTIGEYAFYLSGLTKVTVPKKVTSIGASAFGYCSSLTKIAVSSGNTKYSAKSGVLYNADKTKLINYPAGKSSKSFTVPGTVKTIYTGAFIGALNLKTISLNKVEKIGDMAFFYSGLTKITIPKTVTSIGTKAFGSCESLTKIAVSGSNTKYSAKDGVLYNKAKTKLIAYPLAKSSTSFTVPSTVKKIGIGAFSYSRKLKSVTIGSKVTEIGYDAFYGCAKLKTVVIGSGVKKIGAYAFAQCTSLTTVRFKGSAPTMDPDNMCGDNSADYGGYVFYGDTVTIKYASSEKSSWTKTYRSALNKGAKAGDGKLTFETY